jgi:DeoR family fructose operon transcriptional repressor
MFDYVRMHTMAHMLAHERQEALRSLLAQRGAVAVADLARRWKVSEMTIRRDLAALAADGSVARVHGGAVPGDRLRFGARLERNRSGKQAAARKLLPLIPEHGAIYLDGSTTVYQLAGLLEGRHGLTVATNSVDTFQRLVQRPGLEAVLIGGSRDPATDNLIGPLARRALEGLSFSAACFSAYALHPDHGPAEPSAEDAEIKRLVCIRSTLVLLAVDHDKLGLDATGCWQPAAERTTLATDLLPGDKRLKPFSHQFHRIV